MQFVDWRDSLIHQNVIYPDGVDECYCFARRFEPVGDCHGVVLIVHDSFLHGGLHIRFATGLAQRGYLVYLPDQAGSGLDPTRNDKSLQSRVTRRLYTRFLDHIRDWHPEARTRIVALGTGAIIAARCIEDGQEHQELWQNVIAVLPERRVAMRGPNDPWRMIIENDSLLIRKNVEQVELDLELLRSRTIPHLDEGATWTRYRVGLEPEIMQMHATRVLREIRIAFDPAGWQRAEIDASVAHLVANQIQSTGANQKQTPLP